MTFDPDRLRDWPFPEITHTYTSKDTILYALGAGCGSDPLDPAQLRFVYEDGLAALPTMATVLAYPGFWLKDPATGVDWKRLLHGEQAITIHKPLAPAGKVVGRARVTGLIDKGKDKGAHLYHERKIHDAATDEPIATLTATVVLRGNGGYGGPSGPAPEPHKLPDRAPDSAHDIKTVPQAALIYRLSGDDNPLHADPRVAAAAGFKAPILHGLATYAVAGRALIAECCGSDSARLRHMAVRFSAPVYPGETIRTEIWRNSSTEIAFRARAVERDTIVLNNGFAKIV
jgi:acyl dehydratase